MNFEVSECVFIFLIVWSSSLYLFFCFADCCSGLSLFSVFYKAISEKNSFLSFVFFFLMIWIYFLVNTFNILSCAVSFFLPWLVRFFYSNFDFLLSCVIIFQVQCSFVSWCALNILLFTSLLFCICFLYDWCFWYHLKLYSMLLFSEYKLFCEMYFSAVAFHLLCLFFLLLLPQGLFHLRNL